MFDVALVINILRVSILKGAFFCLISYNVRRPRYGILWEVSLFSVGDSAGAICLSVFEGILALIFVVVINLVTSQ